jgi:hypothetical protein
MFSCMDKPCQKWGSKEGSLLEAWLWGHSDPTPRASDADTRRIFQNKGGHAPTQPSTVVPNHGHTF